MHEGSTQPTGIEHSGQATASIFEGSSIASPMHKWQREHGTTGAGTQLLSTQCHSKMAEMIPNIDAFLCEGQKVLQQCLMKKVYPVRDRRTNRCLYDTGCHQVTNPSSCLNNGYVDPCLLGGPCRPWTAATRATRCSPWPAACPYHPASLNLVRILREFGRIRRGFDQTAPNIRTFIVAPFWQK